MSNRTKNVTPQPLREKTNYGGALGEIQTTKAYRKQKKKEKEGTDGISECDEATQAEKFEEAREFFGDY